MRQIRTSGLMSGEWKRELLPVTRATPRLYQRDTLLVLLSVERGSLLRRRAGLTGGGRYWATGAAYAETNSGIRSK